MYKSKTKERRIFGHRRRVRRRSSRIWAFISVGLFLLILELLTRIFIDLSGDNNKFAQTQTEPNIVQAYRLNFMSQNSPAQQLVEDKQLLLAKPSVSVGYQLVSNQKAEYWQINEQGFRDRDPLPLVKPDNEIRIFLLGGSTAFGYGAASNDATISEYLEKRLQQRIEQQQTSPHLYQSNTPLPAVTPQLAPANLLTPTTPNPDKAQPKPVIKPAKLKSGKYRVINAAVPGYTSGNELARMALDVLKYKPDLIVMLDGYEDLMLDSEEEATQAPQATSYFNQPAREVVGYLDKLMASLENKSYLAKIAQSSWIERQKAFRKADFLLNEQTSNLVKHLPTNQEELEKRVNRYVAHQKQILSLSAAARVPMVVAIQPEITGRNPSQLTDAEGAIATDLGRNYIQRMRDDYPVLITAISKLAKTFPYNLEAVDLYKLSDQYPSPSFIDPVHLNEAANQKVAEQLYYTITNLTKMQEKPPKPTIVNKRIS